MPRQNHGRNIRATLESAEFRLKKAEDIDVELHEEIKNVILGWAESHDFDQDRAREVWSAVYEAIQNALRWGSESGETIYIRLQAMENGHLRAEIEQPREWPEWEHKLGEPKGGVPRGKITEEEIILGGTVVMQRLADGISVLDEGRRVVMSFASRVSATADEGD